MPWQVYNSAGQLLQATDLPDNAVTNAKVADDAIGVAELSASGTASNSTFLRGDNAWAAAGGGALTLVNTTTISSASDVTITGLTNTYDAFLIVGSEITLATHSAQLQLRCGDSSGVDSGSSDYSYSVEYLQAGSTAHTAYSSEGATFILVLNYMSSQSQSWHGGGFHCWLYRNGGSGGSTMATFTGQGVSYYGANMIGGTFIGARNTTIDIDRIQIRANSGNVATGRLTVWGLKHT